MTYNGSTALIYINGALVASTAGISPRTNFSYDVPLPNSSIRQLCDLRIYDHVLSPKEIKEISKGLVLHYPLDSQYETGQQNKFSGDVAAGLVGPGSFTRTKLADERGYNYKLTRTGNGGNSLPSLGTAAYSFTAGKRYYYSVKVRCNKWTVGTLRLRASRSSNDLVTNSVAVCSPTLADGQLHEYYTSQVVNETYERSGTVTCNPVLEFYADNQNGDGIVYDMDFDLKDVQVVESDVYVPFIQNEYAGTTVRDTSGFGNHGTRSGTLSLVSSNTPRYDSCLDFNKSGYIIKDPFNVTVNAFTLNFLVNLKAMSSQHFIFGTFSSLPNNGIGLLRDTGTPTKYSCLIKSDSESTYSSQGITGITIGTLNMITLVYNGTTYKGYLNNNQVFSVTYGSNGTITNPNFMVGNSKYNSTPASENEEAYISDFRFYVTALSADDIKELYQTSASITNNGSVMCLDFQEN